jgi:hypothetical protein
MTRGLRLRIEVGSPRECPIAEVSETASADVEWVARTAGGDTVTEEFTLPETATLDRADVTEVMQYDAERVYRFEREAGQGCACEHVEEFGCPVSAIRAHEGALSLSCHATTDEEARRILEALQAEFDGVRLQCLTRSGGDRDRSDPVIVDRGVLTERQREVLSTALEMGYFERPRETNAEAVAAALEIAPSTLAEHLAAAQSKLTDAVLNGDD